MLDMLPYYSGLHKCMPGSAFSNPLGANRCIYRRRWISYGLIFCCDSWAGVLYKLWYCTIIYDNIPYIIVYTIINCDD